MDALGKPTTPTTVYVVGDRLIGVASSPAEETEQERHEREIKETLEYAFGNGVLAQHYILEYLRDFRVDVPLDEKTEFLNALAKYFDFRCEFDKANLIRDELRKFL